MLARTSAECGAKCRSRRDATLTNNVISSSASDAATLYALICQPHCSFPGKNCDLSGTTALHKASSKGKCGLIQWLLSYNECSINAKDSENGYTALHRAIFYGQLRAALILIEKGANLNVCDFEGLTPLDHLVLDAPNRLIRLCAGPFEAYVWGANASLNLGLAHQQSRNWPEVHEGLRKIGFASTAALQKFHSAFVTGDGKVFSCGHGQGGRLGHDDELSQLTPKQIRGLDSYCITKVALGVDHSLFLGDQGQVFVCGTNTHHQLGLVPPPKLVLVPQVINSFSVGKVQKGSNKQSAATCPKVALGIGAARFHSLLWSNDELFTWGLNAGQLGHMKSSEQTIITPKLVVFQRQIAIKSVATSEAAIVVLSQQGDVLALHEYQIRRIAVKQLNVVKIEVIGGHLDYQVSSKAFAQDLKLVERGGQELKIFLLNDIGKISVWEEKFAKGSAFVNCVFNLNRDVVVADIAVNRANMIVVTDDGQAYEATHISKRMTTTTSSPSTTTATSSSSLAAMVERNVCDLLKARRLPHVFRGAAAFSDPKGRNFCILQQVANSNLIDLPQVEPSRMKNELKELLESTSENDELHDVIFEVGHRRFAAHKFIVASNSSVLAEMITGTDNENKVVKLDMDPALFEHILTFIYTHTCDLLQPGFRVAPSPEVFENESKTKKKSKNKRKSSNTNNENKDNNSNCTNLLVELQAAARNLGVNSLVKALDNVCLDSNVVSYIRGSHGRKGVVSFNSKGFPELSDCVIMSEDGEAKRCHKCVLAARLEYFRSMFTLSWMESKETQLSLPIDSRLLHVLIEYLYRDEVAPKLLQEETDEFVFNLLVVADQLLARRLVHICELELAQRLSLKNVIDILQCTSDHFQTAAPQLYRSTKHFLCLNLAAAIDAKMLHGLDAEILDDLGRHYRNEATEIEAKRRLFADNDTQLSLQIEQLHEQNPLSIEEMLELEQDNFNNNNNALSPSKPKSKVQRKTRVRNGSGNSSDSDSSTGDNFVTVTKARSKSNQNNGFHKMGKNDKWDMSDDDFILDEKVSFNSKAIAEDKNKSVSKDEAISKGEAASKEETSDSSSFLTSFFLNRKVDAATAASVRNAAAAANWNRRFTRKSQRERQKSLSEEVTNENASSETPKPTWSGWGSVESSPSFTEIVRAQKSEAVSKTDSAKNVTKRGKRASWKALSISEDDTVVTEVKTPVNPWLKNINMENTNVTNKTSHNGDGQEGFASILNDELRQSETLHRVQSKPLLLTQIEEQAIMELERFYDVQGAQDEIIRVERVPQGQMATPIWIKH